MSTCVVVNLDSQTELAGAQQSHTEIEEVRSACHADHVDRDLGRDQHSGESYHGRRRPDEVGGENADRRHGRGAASSQHRVLEHKDHGWAGDGDQHHRKGSEGKDSIDAHARMMSRAQWRSGCGPTVRRMVELRGFEPLTFSLRTRRATNCATAPERQDHPGAVGKDTTLVGPLRIRGRPTSSGQEPTARAPSVPCSPFRVSACAAWASAAIWASSAVRPDVQVPGSPRSMVRTVRLARGLVT